MLRHVMDDIQYELEKLDNKLDYYASKYGTVFHNGYEYVCCDSGEPVIIDSGEKIIVGDAFRRDRVNISEDYEESDGLDQINIMADIFYYEIKDDGEVIRIEEHGQLRWEGNYFGI